MSKISVLVVDDAAFIRDLVKKCLRNYFPGIRTEDAVNGKKAQAMLAKEAFDLVLCDWEMPEMSGLELLTWCREQDNLKTMPFVMVTSRGDKENVVQAIQAGVSGYVSKPFTNEQLLTKVKQALNKVGKLDALMSGAPTKNELGIRQRFPERVDRWQGCCRRTSPGCRTVSRLAQHSAGQGTGRCFRACQRARSRPTAPAEWHPAMRDQGLEHQGSTAGGEAH